MLRDKLNFYQRIFLNSFLLFFILLSCSPTERKGALNIQKALGYKSAMMGVFTQGGFALGHIKNAKHIFLNDVEIERSSDGLFFLGFEIDHPKQAIIRVIYTDDSETTQKVIIEERSFPQQNINFRHSKRNKKPNQEWLDRVLKESKIKQQIKATKTNKLDFFNKWQEPAHGRITGVYGAKRTYNNVSQSTHFGIDIALIRGTKILAPTDGRVLLADHFVYSGKLIFLDHGHSVLSAYLHLDEIWVKAGQLVKQGDVIGLSGSTGMSTGPHLDWRVYWRGINLDPSLITSAKPSYISF